jgi:hypothetical protein
MFLFVQLVEQYTEATAAVANGCNYTEKPVTTTVEIISS